MKIKFYEDLEYFEIHMISETIADCAKITRMSKCGGNARINVDPNSYLNGRFSGFISLGKYKQKKG